MQARAPAGRGWRWRRTRVALSLGVLVTGVWATTLAVFTGSASVGGNDFTMGTVDIAASPAAALLTLGAMAPGDSVTAPLTVSNAGTLQLRYAMAGSATGDAALAAALGVTVRSGVSDCSEAGFAASGTPVASGTLAAVWFGDPAQGAHAGDRVLPGGWSEVLCFQASLPLSAADALQGTAATGTFVFSAEQTANN